MARTGGRWREIEICTMNTEHNIMPPPAYEIGHNGPHAVVRILVIFFNGFQHFKIP